MCAPGTTERPNWSLEEEVRYLEAGGKKLIDTNPRHHQSAIGTTTQFAYVKQIRQRYDIYVGSDNETHEQNEEYLSKVLDWAGRVFPKGYTLVRGEGHFGQSEECSLIVSAIVERELELSCDVRALKKILKQEAILVTKCAVEAKMV